MNQLKRRLAGFCVAVAAVALLCVAAQTAKADNLNLSQCAVTFTVSHPDTSGRPYEYVNELDYALPTGFQFIPKSLVKANNSLDFKYAISTSGVLVLTLPLPPNQFPKTSYGTSQPTSFQFSIGIQTTTGSCNYGTGDLAGTLVTTKLSDGLITTSRSASDGLGNLVGGTGTPAGDIPATIDPAKFTQLPGSLPCSPGTDTNEKLPNGCPDPDKVGGIDGNPLLEGGQLSQSPAVRSCTPSGALATLIQNPNTGMGSVTAYVANGSWSTANTGLQVVPIEPAGGIPSSISTSADVINSCASNSATGQTVCTANNANLYLLSGNPPTVQIGQTSAAGTAQFSHGTCQNCGVMLNQSTNTAAITMGLGSGTTGLQFLDLGSNNLSAPVAAANQVSEGIVWDAARNLILSPSENSLNTGNSGIYDLFDTASVPSPLATNGQAVPAPEYTNTVSEGGGQVQLDSAAEDCTTGIALATNEAQSKLYLADLSQLQKTAGSPTGSWTVGTAQNFTNLSEFASYVPGVTGAAVAPGSHLAIVTGEFGGNQFGVLQLPATSGSGAPNLVDHVAATLPPLPDTSTWSQGLDPHAITAYVSPNNGKAYGLLANAPLCTGGSHLPASYLAVIDLAGVLTAPRSGGSTGVLTSPIVRYVPTGSTATCPPT